jgi:hypothetical protein
VERSAGIIRSIASLLALGAFAAQAADFTGEWSATIVTPALDYTGALVSDTQIRFKRRLAGNPYRVVEFVATREATKAATQR